DEPAKPEARGQAVDEGPEPDALDDPADGDRTALHDGRPIRTTGRGTRRPGFNVAHRSRIVNPPTRAFRTTSDHPSAAWIGSLPSTTADLARSPSIRSIASQPCQTAAHSHLRDGGHAAAGPTGGGRRWCRRAVAGPEQVRHRVGGAGGDLGLQPG